MFLLKITIYSVTFYVCASSCVLRNDKEKYRREVSSIFISTTSDDFLTTIDVAFTLLSMRQPIFYCFQSQSLFSNLHKKHQVTCQSSYHGRTSDSKR